MESTRWALQVCLPYPVADRRHCWIADIQHQHVLTDQFAQHRWECPAATTRPSRKISSSSEARLRPCNGWSGRYPTLRAPEGVDQFQTSGAQVQPRGGFVRNNNRFVDQGADSQQVGADSRPEGCPGLAFAVQ